MTHIDLKPRGIKPPLDLLPVGPLMAIAACYAESTHLGSPSLDALPYQPLCAAVSALHDGATKYERWNWLERTPDDREVYCAAAMRHVVAYNDDNEDDYADDSKVHHLCHAFATVVILMEKLEIEWTLPTESFEAELDSSALFQLMAFAHPTTADYDETYGLHRLAIAGFLILRELGLESIGYHESVAVQEAKALAAGTPTRAEEITQLVEDQSDDDKTVELVSNGTLPSGHRVSSPAPEFRPGFSFGFFS